MITDYLCKVLTDLRIIHANRIVIIAYGPSWHAALIGKRIIQEMCQIPIEVELFIVRIHLNFTLCLVRM